MLRRVLIGLISVGVLTLSSAGVASAETITRTDVIRTTLDEFGNLACTDPDATQHITGVVQTVSHVTEDAAGGFTVVFNSNAAHYEGVDLETGQRYAGVGTPYGNQTMHVGANGFPATTTYVTPAHLIAQGPPNPGVTFEFLWLVHVTVNATGETVVDLDTVREECH
jgi:hypothetical protein